MAHDADRHVAAFVRRDGRDDELDGGVLQDGADIGHALRLREDLHVGGGEIVLDGVDGDKLAAGVEQALRLAIDVVVVQADGREPDAALAHSVTR